MGGNRAPPHTPPDAPPVGGQPRDPGFTPGAAEDDIFDTGAREYSCTLIGLEGFSTYDITVQCLYDPVEQLMPPSTTLVPSALPSRFPAVPVASSNPDLGGCGIRVSITVWVTWLGVRIDREPRPSTGK